MFHNQHVDSLPPVVCFRLVNPWWMQCGCYQVYTCNAGGSFTGTLPQCQRHLVVVTGYVAAGVI